MSTYDDVAVSSDATFGSGKVKLRNLIESLVFDKGEMIVRVGTFNCTV